MVFVLFSALVAAVFFAGSLILLNYGRHLGLHYLKTRRVTAGGFGMAAVAARSWIHLVIFAATLTVTLYTVTDMTARLDSDRKFRSFSGRGLRANAVTSQAHPPGNRKPVWG